MNRFLTPWVLDLCVCVQMSYLEKRINGGSGKMILFRLGKDQDEYYNARGGKAEKVVRALNHDRSKNCVFLYICRKFKAEAGGKT
jgi:hypothetical protein